MYNHYPCHNFWNPEYMYVTSNSRVFCWDRKYLKQFVYINNILIENFYIDNYSFC